MAELKRLKGVSITRNRSTVHVSLEYGSFGSRFLMRYLKLVTINAAILILLLELVSTAYYTATHGGVFYFRAHPDVVGEVDEPKPQQKLSLHPVFGFARIPGISVDHFLGSTRSQGMFSNGDTGGRSLIANSDGFFSAEEYPYDACEDEYIVGVFGGSVAQWMAVQSFGVLEKTLTERFPGRRVKVLNFAQGGFKQPQQLQAFVYYLAQGQRFDAVINLDGYNEIVLGTRNADQSLPTAFPSLHAVAHLYSSSGLEGDFGSVVHAVDHWRARQRLDTVQGELASAPIAILWLWQKYREWGARQALASSESALVQVSGEELAATLGLGGRPVIDPIDIWLQSSNLMQTIASAKGMRYLHVLQPNQYFSEHEFGQDEASLALRPESAASKLIPAVYPEMRNLGRQRIGRQFVDGTSVFDLEGNAIYVDSCCHVNQLGNDILAEFIARELVR